MFKGGIPPFKKLNKNIVKINKSREFNPDLLLSSLIVKKTDDNKISNRSDRSDTDDDDDDDDDD